MPPVPPAMPLSNTSVGVVTLSGVCVPVLISEPWYWVPVLLMAPEVAPPRLPPPDADPPFLATWVLVALLAEAKPLEEEPLRLADEPPLLEALRPPPELLEAVLEALRLADERFEEPDLLADEPLEALRPADFWAVAFLGAAFLAVPPFEDLEAPPFFAAVFLGAAFLGAAFLAAPPFFAAAFLGAAFFAAAFLGAAFLAAPFFAAAFDEPLPEDEPPLEDEPPRLADLEAPFLDAPFDEDLPPPEDLLPPFFAAAFLVDFAIVDRI